MLLVGERLAVIVDQVNSLLPKDRVVTEALALRLLTVVASRMCFVALLNGWISVWEIIEWFLGVYFCVVQRDGLWKE